MQSIIFSLLVAFLATAQSDPVPTMPTAQDTSSDNTYPNYAIRYLGLGDYKQQSNLNGDNNAVIYTAPDQDGYVRYITYTSDGNNIYQTTVRVKPGMYPVISSTPVKSKPTDVTTNEDATNNGGQLPQTHDDSHTSEDAIPMTLPIEHIEEIPEATSILPDIPVYDDTISGIAQPAAQESQHGLPKMEEDKDNKHNSKEGTDNIISAGNNNLNGNTISPANTKIITQYMRSPYGTIAFYPMSYNPYTGQKRLIPRLMSISANGQLLSIPSTVATPGDTTTKTMIQTLKPLSISGGVTTTRPGIVSTSGPPVRVQPMSYVYPYINYQNQNSGLVYQLPAQPFTTTQQYIRWVQSQSRYQSTFPQGYMSYHPALLAMRNALLSNQNVQPKISVTPTVQTLENLGQQ